MVDAWKEKREERESMAFHVWEEEIGMFRS